MKSTYLKSVSVSATGRSHLTEQIPCQDAAAASNKNGVHGICVCDGAGSASHSDIGANEVANLLLDIGTESFEFLYSTTDDTVVNALLSSILERLGEVADQEKIDLGKLACTVVFTFATIRKKNVHFVSGNLGDGIVIMREGRDMKVVLGAENHEFANVTWFVTSKDAAEHFRICRGIVPVDHIPGWILSTDGAASLLYSRRSNKFAPATFNLLEDLRTEKKNRRETLVRDFLQNCVVPATFDDCSLSMLQTITRSRRLSRSAM